MVVVLIFSGQRGDTIYGMCYLNGAYVGESFDFLSSCLKPIF